MSDIKKELEATVSAFTEKVVQLAIREALDALSTTEKTHIRGRGLESPPGLTESEADAIHVQATNAAVKPARRAAKQMRASVKSTVKRAIKKIVKKEKKTVKREKKKK